MLPPDIRRQAAIAGAASVALLAGFAVSARPVVHLVRRTHASVTARTEWVRWVKAARPETGVGEPAGWLSIPSIGIDTIVLMGDTKENLQRYPCLSRRSISFSEPGFVKVVAAHRDTHFRRLGRISTGDRVRITLKDKRVLTYRVCDMEVVSRETAERRVAEKDGGDWLVLMTCHPFAFAGAAPERFLVWARREPPEPLYERDKEPALRRAGGRPSTYFPPPGTTG